MNRHTVFVAGKRFILLSDDDKDYVQQLAKEVNSAINQISSENPTLESRGCAILCALDYADDKNKEIEKNKSLSDNAKTVLRQSDKHAKQIKELKDMLAQRDKEIEKLEKEKEELNKEIKSLKEEKKNAEEKSLNPETPVKSEKPQETEKAEITSENAKEISQTAPSAPSAPIPKQKAKKHRHNHTNPYKQASLEKSEEKAPADGISQKGYTPVRQYSLFDDEQN